MDSTESQGAAVPHTALPLVLASQSPRRRDLLARLGVPFTVASADVDETPQPGEAPADLVQRLAQAKARAVAVERSQEAVLAADTIVVLGTEILGKPGDEGEAVHMLRRLRGRDHQVLSAVYGYNPVTGQIAAELDRSVIWMRCYSDEEVAAYVASGDPMDKAGAYAIQSRSFRPVARIDGCFSGVMGFPLACVARVLSAMGVPVLGSVIQACRPDAGRCCQER